jgi:transcriptional regulator with XRE-family HTH domain
MLYSLPGNVLSRVELRAMSIKIIRELRDEFGWSQFELASRVGVTPSTVYNWESGRTEPRLSQLRALSEVFGMPMGDIAMNDKDRMRLGKVAA